MAAQLNFDWFTSKIDQLTTDLDAVGVRFYLLPDNGPFTYEEFTKDFPYDAHNNMLYTSTRSFPKKLLDKSGESTTIEIQHEFHFDDDDLKKNTLCQSVNEILIRHFPLRTRGYETEEDTISIYTTPFETKDQIPKKFPKRIVYASVKLEKESELNTFIDFLDNILKKHDFGFVTSYPAAIKAKKAFDIELLINIYKLQEFTDFCNCNSQDFGTMQFKVNNLL